MVPENSDYYHTKESVDQYIAAAEGFNGSELINELKKHLPAGKSVLEIGSGPGADFEILMGDYAVVGSDFSNEFISRLNIRFPSQQFLNLDATTLKTNLKFDAIYSNKVLQHLSNEQLEKSIEAQIRCLNTDGIICHSFWKGKGNESFEGSLVNYQTKESLLSFFREKFTILYLEEYKEFEAHDSLLLIAQLKP